MIRSKTHAYTQASVPGASSGDRCSTSTTYGTETSTRTKSIPASSVAKASAQNPYNSDEDVVGVEIHRGRNLDKALENSLHEAVSSIKLTRSLSPEEFERVNTQQKSDSVDAVLLTIPKQFGRQNRPSHNKSASVQDLSYDVFRHRKAKSEAPSDDEGGEAEISAIPRPHRMVRKKSGELVRSSLKSLSGRRPASMPSTPVFTKNVHFDRKLEHIRHFLHSEKPAAVSANTSPNQEYLHQTEFPFNSSTKDEYELSIDLPNFVPEAQQTDNDGAIIKVETVYLSTDKRSLIGRVAVRNLSYQKYVCVRYTMDYWRTTSESAAEYTQDVRRKQRDDAFDRFLFRIKIDDFAGVTDKTMFFCVRYNAAGQDYWDSNGGMNFRVEFHKEPQAERRYSDPPAIAPFRPSSKMLQSQEVDLSPKLPISSESLDYEDIYDKHPVSSLDDVDQEQPIVVKSTKKRGISTGDTFSNRYDFGASLTAAIAAANSMLQGSDGEIKVKTRNQTHHVEDIRDFNPYFAVKPAQIEPASLSGTMSPSFPPALDSSENNTPASSGNVSPVPGITTRGSSTSTGHGHAYQELLNNYCFVCFHNQAESSLLMRPVSNSKAYSKNLLACFWARIWSASPFYHSGRGKSFEGGRCGAWRRIVAQVVGRGAITYCYFFHSSCISLPCVEGCYNAVRSLNAASISQHLPYRLLIFRCLNPGHPNMIKHSAYHFCVGSTAGLKSVFTFQSREEFDFIKPATYSIRFPTFIIHKFSP